MRSTTGETLGCAIAVFPFLKTTNALQLGCFRFRSTDDLDGLGEEDAQHVRAVSQMFFLRDDLRIRSSSYAMLPSLDLDKAAPALAELEHVQSVVAYCYSSPHATSGDPFFHFENASLVLLSPQPVSEFLVRPEYHVEATDPSVSLGADRGHNLPGYRGLYNFRHHFWVAKSSRLYPPVPHLGLNIAQDLASDLAHAFAAPQHHLLPRLLRDVDTPVAQRVLTALRWHNRANAAGSSDDCAVLDLAVAFEALLALPKDAKTDRFVDAIALLLGRVPRLGQWAEQFYAARSDVAHEGRANHLRFMPAKAKISSDGPLYQPLMTFGRHVFRLCVGAILFGAQLAEQAGLQDKLVTNQERFEFICKTLADTSLPVEDRFAAIADTVDAVNEYRFVSEKGLRIETMLGAVRLAAANLLACDASLESAIKPRVEGIAIERRSPDSYEALDALRAYTEIKWTELPAPRTPHRSLYTLAESVWHYSFMHYFWIKRGREE
jgi:hypothetical protein